MISARHLESDLTAEPLDGLDQLEPHAWDRLVPSDRRGLSHRYLSTWEHVELEALRGRPLVVRDPGSDRIVAATPGYLYDFDVTAMASPWLKRSADLLRRAWPRLFVARVYELGCPTPISEPLMHDPDVPARQAAEALLEAALREARDEDAHVLVVQDFDSVGDTADVLSALGFEALPILPTVVMDLPFGSFDDYLGAMRAQYRRRARKAFERSSALRVERHHDFTAFAPEFARLSRRMFDRAQEVKREATGERYFRAASSGDAHTALVLRRADGSVASFAVLLADGPCLRFLHCGFELDAGRREGAYFRLLYEIVRCAIEDGFAQIDFGTTTLAPKLDVGGVPVPLVTWIRHPNPLIQKGLAAVARRMFPPEPAEPRKVFKSSLSVADASDSRRRRQIAALVKPARDTGQSDVPLEVAQRR